jgi:predicted kinase
MLNIKNNHKNEIIIIRGLPGSGKSTLAKSMANYLHFEADMYLEINGVYIYDSSKIKQAHDWCVASAKNALEQGANVVVSNTFVKNWEIQRYIELGFPYKIIEAQGKWPNIHGVPIEMIDIMAKRWELLPSDWVAK